MDFLDFDILFERSDDGYRCRVLGSPAGEASGAFRLPFSDLELENFFLRIGQPRRDVRRDLGRDAGHQATVEAFGGQLFDAVFTADVLACLRTSLADADRQSAGLRIRLRMTETPELLNLPWEFLRIGRQKRFLALSNFSPIVRYLDLPERVRPLPVEPPIRVLVLIAAPHDYAHLNSEHEWALLRQSVADLEARGLVHVERLERATLSALQQKLRRGEYHIFHFVGHGDFDEASQSGRLLLEDEAGRGAPVDDDYLGTLLHDHRSLRLVVLNSCEGGRTSQTDPFAGTAQALVLHGIPAVIAMQFEVTDGAAIAFAREFYAAVADGLPVDAAITEGRKAIFSLPNMVEWATPVLYMRAEDGAVFDIQQPAAPDTAAPSPGPVGTSMPVPVPVSTSPPVPVRTPPPEPEPAPALRPDEDPTPSVTGIGQIGGQMRQLAQASRRALRNRTVAAGAAVGATVLLGALWAVFGPFGDAPGAPPPTPPPGQATAVERPGGGAAGSTETLPVRPTTDLETAAGAGPTASAAGPTAAAADPTLGAPRGRLVFHSDPDPFRNDDSEIFSYDLDGRTLRQLTDNRVDDWIASWAAGGARIVYSSEAGNAQHERLHDFDSWIMDADGANAQRIVRTDNWDEYPALAPDGARLAFASTGDTGASEIFIADLRTIPSAGRQVTSLAGNATWPTWSPDGRSIAFSSGPDTAKDLFVLDVATGDTSPLVVGPLVETKPAWSPDGRRIAFTRHGPDADGFGDLYSVRPDGTDEVRLTTAGDAKDPAWSPDGAWLAFARRIGTDAAATTDLWAVHVATGRHEPLVERSGWDLAPSWTD